MFTRSSPYNEIDYGEYSIYFTGTVVVDEIDERGPVPWMDESDDSESERDHEYFCYSLKDVIFEVGGDINHPVDVCRFLSTMMREKCSKEIDYQYAAKQQPEWVKNDGILDRVTSYASFVEQAGSLSLVSRKLRSSALGQLNKKMVKFPGIFFGTDEYQSSLRVEARHILSETVSSKEGAIDDALWLAKCCCKGNACKEKETCPCRNKTRVVKDGKEENELNLIEVKEKLMASGTANLTSKKQRNRRGNEEYVHTVTTTFGRLNNSVLSTIDNIRRSIEYRVNFFDSKELEQNYGCPPVNNGWNAEAMRTKRFFRTLLYVLTTSVCQDSYIISNDQVKIMKGKVSVNSPDENCSFWRWISVYRFHSANSAAGDPVEIFLEYFNRNYDW